LRNVRRLAAVTTHGSSKFLNMVEGESGKRTLTRSLRSMCHPFARTTWLAMYGIDNASDDERAAFLDRVERRMARLA
jgi:putative NADPH-quinone reductase